MRYQKPVVMDLSGGARARGDTPDSCISGTGPGNEGICATGSSATFNAGCNPGSGAGDCGAGFSASFTCLSGPAPTLGYECSAGGGGAAGNCTVGPSNLAV